MSTCVQSIGFFVRRNRRQDKRERMLRKMSAMRVEKERKRLLNPPEREPKMERYFPLELGVRDTRNGDTAWVTFKSIRDACRRLAVIQRFYT